jgi:competence protein ComEC
MAGQKWEWDGVQFELLHPLFSDYAKLAGSNALSCVLRVDASQQASSKMSHERQQASALLVGDIRLASCWCRTMAAKPRLQVALLKRSSHIGRWFRLVI